MFRNRTFQFSQEITVLTVLAAILCGAMGYWQYTRYLDKKAYFRILAERGTEGVRTFEPATADWTSWEHATVSLTGIFDHEREMFLTNRSMDNTSGVHIVTPFEIAGSGEYILVDRGFIPYDRYVSGNHSQDRVEGIQHLEGIVRPSRTRQFFIAPPAGLPAEGPWKERWLRLEIEAMAEQLPYRPLPVYIEQTNQPGLFPIRDAREVLPAARHLNYAIQWAGFGAFIWLLGLYFQFRPRKKA